MYSDSKKKSCMRILIFTLLLIVTSTIQAQDPKALKLLKAIEKKYEKTAYKMDFNLSVKQAEVKKPKVQTGVFAFSKDAYSLSLPDQKICFDGKTQWTYMIDRKEVQITHAELSESAYHPLKFIQLYKADQFKYRVESSDQNKSVIEFVPLQENQEYHKVKLSIQKKSGVIHSIEVFLKNGDRYTMTVTKHTILNKIDVDQFKLDTSQLKGVHIEDLR